MLSRMQQITGNEHLRAALDWTVFGLGVLSLTIAITATIVTQSANAQSDSRAESVLAAG